MSARARSRQRAAGTLWEYCTKRKETNKRASHVLIEAEHIEAIEAHGAAHLRTDRRQSAHGCRVHRFSIFSFLVCFVVSFLVLSFFSLFSCEFAHHLQCSNCSSIESCSLRPRNMHLSTTVMVYDESIRVRKLDVLDG